MKYFIKYSYYMIISFAFLLLISLITNGFRIEIFPIVLSNLYILRLLDDYCDFGTDTKEKILSKKSIKYLMIVLSIVFLLLNIVFYNVSGLVSLAILLYMILENKFEIMKVLLLFFESLYFICMYNSLNTVGAIIYLGCCIIFSTCFYIFKRRKIK